MQLPVDFEKRMKDMLGDEYHRFMDTYNEERAYGIRFNPLKISREDFEKKVHATTERVPWAEEGYYYNPEMQPGKAPLHEAGAYYIQEPSAMSAAELLDVEKGDIVCDLCAAPGGKSTQIAGKLDGTGMLVSNEFYGSRAKILSQNIERMGIRNAVVLNESTEHMAELFPDFFDKIMVDAPCSGEGMFRKDEAACGEWSIENVDNCAKRQAKILDDAAMMVKPGGVMVYSTCTFSREENEYTVRAFLDSHPQFYIDRPSNHDKLVVAGVVENDGMYRLWPHKLRGEGHFAVRFAKRQEAEEREYKRKYVTGTKKKEDLKYFKEFADSTLNVKLNGEYVLFGDSLYIVPENMIDLKGIKVERAGLKLGCNKKNRFEPDHALALSLKPTEVKQVTELNEPEKYLRGETVECEYDKGWTLATINNIPIGWGKAQNGVLKNHYPKGLRKC
ncbi:MAG: RsmF rRNA methyltransferase first C-terminal domain-containing protein [Lachnospiraceae bacterium]|nr:RsmF rRNA methyltransferase first C-terminal domain-containing protein [Lachnospiraceae bacterium]